MSRLQYKYIKYSGYSTLPDDYQAEDGSIAFATNTIYEDGGLKSIPECLRMKLVVAENAQVYIHHMVNYYHYIIIYQTDDGVKLYLVDRERMKEALQEGAPYIDAIYHVGSTGDRQENMTDRVVDFLYSCKGQFVDIQAVANTLVVSTDENMYYFLCKTSGVEEDNVLTDSCTHPYIFLGNKVPSVELQFGLSLECKRKNYFDLGLTEADLYPSSESEFKELFKGAKTLGGVDVSGVGTYSFGKSIKLNHLKRYGLWYVQASGYSSNTISMTLVGTNSAGELVTLVTTGNTRCVFSVDEDYEVVNLQLTDSDKAPTGEVLLEEIDMPLGVYGQYLNYTEDNYEAVAGCINKFVADYGRNDGKFIHPFFVRYAVRLYDESVCELSVPILMTPNSDYVPFVYFAAHPDADKDVLSLFAFIGTLQYKMLNSIDSNWRDIIQSVDLYVSSPIYPYNLDKEDTEGSGLFSYKSKNDSSNIDQVTDLSFGIGYLNDTLISSEKLYRKHDLYTTAHDMYGLFYWTYEYIVQAAAKEADSIDEEIKNNASFYLIKRFNLDDLSAKSDFEDVTLEDGVLEGLEAREALSEDVVNYEQAIGCGLHSYNSRLHTYGGVLKYRDFVYPAYQVQAETYEDGSTYTVMEAWVYIRTNDGTKCVKTTYDLGLYYTRGFLWLFYPNNRAFKVIIKLDSERTLYLTFNLSEHDFLNGAYCFKRVDSNIIDSADETSTTAPSEEDIDDTIPATSIYVSEVNNPFTFTNSAAVTVGSGQVLALSSAAQAMSQGQFGQYPLYVFTDEGVWALEVASDGTYSTSQPITRDVCTNVESITQLDSSVLFVTDRGIMHLVGSKVECISESIDGENGEFNPLELPYFDEIYLKYLCDGDSLTEAERESKLEEIHEEITEWATTRFFDFIRTCRILYDYTHQRVIVYNNTSSVAYNFSLKTKAWSLMFTRLRYTLNSYPYALALCNLTTEQETAYNIPQDNEEHWELVALSSNTDNQFSSDAGDSDPDEEEDTTEPMMFVTRPFKLDNANMFKTIDSIVQRGYFQQSKRENHIIGTVLYGSPDLFNWFFVGQSATTEETDGGLTPGHIIDKMEGSPYKYFRVLVLASLDSNENVCGCSVLYEPKDTNQLR